MPETGISIVSLPVGSGGAYTSTAQLSLFTSKGAASPSADQGISSVCRVGALTSLGQTVPLSTRGGMQTSAFQVASHSSGAVTSASGFQAAVYPSRQRFYVELKEGETNVVSWKKLLKDSQKNVPLAAPEAPAGANPALEARFGNERAGLVKTNMSAVQDAHAPPTNRFSSVIEKIERLYKGVDSDEEDTGDVSQYDSDDDFIDDTELNEYFSVDKAKTKHTGFFVNRGKLEKVTESLPPSPVYAPRKRKRKDVIRPSGELLAEEFAKKRVNTGLRLKDAARKTSVSISGTGLEAGSSMPFKTSEQSLIGKPKKRVKPVLDEGDTSVELISELNNGHSLMDTLRDGGNCKEIKDSVNKGQETVVECFDDENDGVKVSKSDFDGIEKGISDVAVSGRQAMKRTEAREAYGDERINSRKSVTDPVEEKPVRDVPRETKIPLAVPKVRNNQQLTKDEDSRDPEGSGKALSAFLTSSPGPKEVSPKKSAGWPKGTVLERAIHDFERGVAEAFPLTGDRQAAIQNAEAGGKSKRLPRDIKQKLAKVARLAAKKGKISDELIDRLMNIIGHVMRLKTLKRNLKSMVEMGLNAKQEKDVRLQDMKREVTELVRSRVSTFLALDADQRDASSDSIQATQGSERGNVTGRYRWDQTTEDRICDLYDHYVEGMDEHKGPQIRKLYIELAELWPDGWMDNHGIKSAVFRAKERKKKQNKLKIEEEKRKRRVAVVADKQRADREALLAEKRVQSTPVSSVFSVANTGGIPANITVSLSKKLTIKSSKHRMDDTRIHREGRRKSAENGQLRHGEEEEEARILAVEAASRHAIELVRKPIADLGVLRDNSTSVPNPALVKPIVKDQATKVQRNEDGVKLKRKLPRKSFEGKIVEHAAAKRPRNDVVDIDSLETYRYMKNSVLNAPLVKVKKKKLKPSLDCKFSARASPAQTTVLSKAERFGNADHPSPSKVTGFSPLKGAAASPFRGGDSDRAKDVARWPSEASRLMND